MGQQITLYRNQINSLDYPRNRIRLYLCEGDSEDDTLAELQAWAVEDDRVRVVKHDTGIPREYHTTRLARMQAVSINGNIGWDKIAADKFGDYAWMVESDLLYDPGVLKRMIERMPAEADIFAPMIWIQVGIEHRFYDVWAYRRGGKKFQPFPPAWYMQRYGVLPFPVDSVGSCVLFRMETILAGLRLSESECVLGMCNQARQWGYKIFVDPDIDIIHPSIEGVR